MPGVKLHEVRPITLLVLRLCLLNVSDLLSVARAVFWGRLSMHFTILPATQSEATTTLYILSLGLTLIMFFRGRQLNIAREEVGRPVSSTIGG